MGSDSRSTLSLDTSVQYVKGIGPKRAAMLKRIDIETVEDLLCYFPRRYLDRSHLSSIRDLKPDQYATVVGRIYSTEVRRGRVKRFIVLVGDGSGFVQCVWFRGIQYMATAFKTGETVAFSGKVTVYRGPQLVHPEYDKISDEGESDPLHTGCIVPLYPSTEFLSKIGLDGRGFRKILKTVVEGLSGRLNETLIPSIIDRHGLMNYQDAMMNIHFPEDSQKLSQARLRLKFEELFYIQLFLALQRQKRQTDRKGLVFEIEKSRIRQFTDSLPFSLTGSQKRILQEIFEDMKSIKPMNRLLQGDVGSGKTVVAALAMLVAVDNGYQASIMAPTEILAEQHYLTLHEWLETLGIRVALLKGGQKAAEKKEVLKRLADGDIDIAIGTHALVQEGVVFKNLGFVAIDEQHRFGVMQRAVLRKKGSYPEVLVMTATPIPRTLALTLYGDLDVSVLDELPAGRKSVRTVWRSEGKRQAIYDFIRDEMKKGRQVYIVYPLVEASEKMDLAAATQGYESLANEVFPDFKVALLHGRMKAEEKEQVMKLFKKNQIHMLVSTTVIEVGVDVPNATVMLIEHAERFGLTQLHQLRGRVGRGAEQATCILLAQYPLSDDAKKRLETMTKSTDGFVIAETDLKIRGPGELFGTKQHGILNLKIASLVEDGKILEKARKEAFHIVEQDTGLEHPENKILYKTYEKRYQGRFGLIEIG